MTHVARLPTRLATGLALPRRAFTPLGAIAAIALATLVAHAIEPSTPSLASPALSRGADASFAASSLSASRPSASTPTAPVAVATWPAQASPHPEAHEWKQATTLSLGERADGAGCKALRLREWVRIRCTSWSIEESILVAGTKADVAMWINGRNRDNEPSLVIEMPVRRGDRRVFQINHNEGRWGGSFAIGFVSELWLDDMAAPVIVFS